MNFFKITLENGVKRIINLSNVSSITLNKKLITVKYNFSNTSGHMFLGSGIIDSNLYEENIYYDNQTCAETEFEKFEKFENSFYKK